MGGWHVRRAERADRDAALALWRALHRHHEALDARYRLAPDAALRWANDFDAWVRDEHHRYLVADAGADGLIGLLVAHTGWPAPVYAPALFVYVDDLFVADAYRGQGVGSALLDQARAWAQTLDAVEVRAGLLAGNTAAQTFWRAQGADGFFLTVALPPKKK